MAHFFGLSGIATSHLELQPTLCWSIADGQYNQPKKNPPLMASSSAQLRARGGSDPRSDVFNVFMSHFLFIACCRPDGNLYYGLGEHGAVAARTL